LKIFPYMNLVIILSPFVLCIKELHSLF
jgi:hypothetical protein